MKSILLALFVVSFGAVGQAKFGDRCLGVWKGTMYIYAGGVLRDSVAVRFTVAQTTTPDVWIWKTDYRSPKMPMVKDYLLRLKDAARSQYITDEGQGIELTGYLFDNKLYSVFETEGVFLTSSYELFSDRLIFEVTSGKKESSVSKEVASYSVDHLQRVVLTKE